MSTENKIPADASDDDLRAMGLPPAFTFDELRSTFEDEEIAQMAEDGLVELPEDFKAPAKVERAADTINRKDDEGADPEEEPEGEDGEGEDGEGGGAAGADDAAGEADPDDPKVEPEVEPDPTLDLRDDKDVREKVDGYDDKLAEIQNSYDDGDISEKDFREQIKALNAEHIAAQRELDQIEQHNTAQREAYASTWYDKVAVFMQENPGLSDQTPIPGLSGAGALQVFDQALRHVTSDDRFSALTMDEKISAAADIADAYAEKHAERKLRQEKAEPAPEPKGDPKAKAKPRQDPRPDPVQTLGNVSAATDTDIEDGRFAAIDRADALEAERMIAKLSDAEREAYLRGA